MATKKQLIDRWKHEPWSSVHQKLQDQVLELAEQRRVLGLQQRERTGLYLIPDELQPRIEPSEMFDLLDGLPFRDEVPSGRDLRGTSWGGGDFLELQETDLSYRTMRDGLCGFDKCNLNRARFDHAQGLAEFRGKVVEVSFRGARFERHARLDGHFEGCCFDGARLNWAKCQGSVFHGCTFHNAHLEFADLQQCDLRGCEFQNADLTGAMLRAVTLDKTTDFRGARLVEATFEELRANDGTLVLAGTDWSNATYDNSTIFGADETAIHRDWLGKIIHEAVGRREPWTPELANMAKQCRDRLDKGEVFDWFNELLGSVPIEARPDAEDLMERAGYH